MSQENVEVVRRAYEAFSRAGTINVWTVRDGRAARMAVHNDKAEALESVALP